MTNSVCSCLQNDPQWMQPEEIKGGYCCWSLKKKSTVQSSFLPEQGWQKASWHHWGNVAVGRKRALRQDQENPSSGISRQILWDWDPRAGVAQRPYTHWSRENPSVIECRPRAWPQGSAFNEQSKSLLSLHLQSDWETSLNGNNDIPFLVWLLGQFNKETHTEHFRLCLSF